ncbi:COG4280 domain-containing protein [Varunaivibrio sulfuroxidans]|nr:hypothetical protein [Varunaivibrio sulfuroxidans]WES30561.1 hypothetical protein P3M64_13110 [Varunaivibrio sulfuroxidans]
MIGLAHSSAAVSAAFLASLVEFVEALTIVLAIGAVRGWRSALLGAAAGVVFLVLLAAAFGPLLGALPISLLQLAIGILLLLFGMRWLRKAILRSAGILKIHDETAIFKRETAELKTQAPTHGPWDAIALIGSFKAVVLEGLEVIFIVIAVGAPTGALIAASVGAGAALLVVVILGVAIHRPLSRVPENTLKFAVGVILSGFGVFWIGTGLGISWPGEDLSILWLIFGFWVTAILSVRLCRGRTTVPSAPPRETAS